MIIGVLTTCHTQYTWYSSICIFYLIEQHSKFLLHTLHVLYMCTLCDSTNINTIIEFVPNSVACQRWWFQWRLWFVPSIPGYLREEEEHKPDPWRNPIERNRMELHISTQNAFSLPFAAILVNCAPSEEMHNYCTPHIVKENFENFLSHRCNYILLSHVYCVWQVVKTPTIIFNNPVLQDNERKQ